MHEHISTFEFPSGRYSLPVSEHAINTSTPVGEVVDRTILINSPDWLEHIYKDETCGSIVNETGTRFGFVRPVAPYADWDLMLMVFPKEIDQSLDTQEIYDFTNSDQQLYWRLLLTGLHKTKELVTSQSDGRPFQVFSTQNCNHFLSNGQFRGARTIKLIHARFLGLYTDRITAAGEVDESGIPLQYGVPDHMFKEWSILRAHSAKISQRVSDLMPPELLGNCTIGVRSSPPFGHSLFFDLPDKNSFSDPHWISMIQQTTAAHYKAMHTFFKSESAGHIVGTNHIRFPQPSFRQYAFLGESHLELVHSYILYSHAGPMEAAGLILHRDIQAIDPVISLQRSEREHQLFTSIQQAL